MTKRTGVILWLVMTVALFVVPVNEPTITVYSDKNADGSGKEYFIALVGLLAVTSLIVGIATLTILWVRSRRTGASV